jgi:hypothetical protein
MKRTSNPASLTATQEAPQGALAAPPSKFLLSRKRVAIGASATGAASLGSGMIGALALGAFALGAVAVGALVIGRLSIGKAHIRKLRIDELEVGRIVQIDRLVEAKAAEIDAGTSVSMDVAHGKAA